MNDRKYGHRGYMESDRGSSGSGSGTKRPSGPRPDRPEGPRGRGADQNKALVILASANAREEADAQAYGLGAMMKSFGDADPKILQALASTGMSPGQLMALAFRDLADNATKIGQLNVTPDLLREMLQPQTGH